MLNRLAQFLKQNFFLVGTTAFPGLHKLLVLFVVNECNGLSLTADFINDIFVLYILGYITVFNWANFILTDMMKITKASQSVFFGKIYGLSLVTTITLIIVLCFFMSNDWIVNDFGFFVLLLFWSYHQLWRHFLIARGRYQKLFFSDSFILIVTISLIAVASHFHWDLFLSMCIPLFLLPILFYPLFPIFNFQRFGKRIWTRALNYTLINLSTGGIQLIFAPLSHHLLSPSFTRIIGFTNNLASIVQLVPRSMTFSFIPKLSAHLRYSRSDFLLTYHKFLRVNNQVVISMFVLGGLGALVIGNLPQYSMSIGLFAFLVFSNLLIGQLSVPSSNVLVVSSQSALLLKVNWVAFIVMMLFMFLIIPLERDGLMKMMVLLSVSIIIGFMRYLYLVNIFKRQYV
jgi:hypothetical protein